MVKVRTRTKTRAKIRTRFQNAMGRVQKLKGCGQKMSKNCPRGGKKLMYWV